MNDPKSKPDEQEKSLKDCQERFPGLRPPFRGYPNIPSKPIKI